MIELTSSLVTMHVGNGVARTGHSQARPNLGIYGEV